MRKEKMKRGSDKYGQGIKKQRMYMGKDKEKICVKNA